MNAEMYVIYDYELHMCGRACAGRYSVPWAFKLKYKLEYEVAL